MAVRATFDSKPPPGCINFGIGQPSGDLTPPALYHEASERFFAHTSAADFNYGDVRGDPKFIASLQAFVTRAYRHPVSTENLFLTGGNSQALDLVCERFTKAGDTVFVEEPCYFLAFQILIDHGLRLVPIPVDADGMRMDVFEERLRTERPVLVYTIPSYSNPTGVTLSRERRERLADLSREHGFVVAADEVYQLLYYGSEPPPAMATLVDRGNVISMGTFSKILAPSFRVGWIQAGKPLVDRIMDSGWVTSGGAVSHFSSLVVGHAIDGGMLEKHIDFLRPAYGARRDAMQAALQAHCGDFATWQQPGGGYFFWLELANGIETTPLKPGALVAGTGFQPGPVFSATHGFANFLRLSFAHYDEQQISEGVARLGNYLRSVIR